MRRFILLFLLASTISILLNAQVEPEHVSEWSEFVGSVSMNQGDGSFDFKSCNGTYAIWSKEDKVIAGFSNDDGKSFNEYYVLETKQIYNLSLKPVEGVLIYNSTNNFLLCTTKGQGPAYLLTLAGEKDFLVDQLPLPLRNRTTILVGNKLSVEEELNFSDASFRNTYIEYISSIMASMALAQGSMELTTKVGHISMWTEPDKIMISYSKDGGKTWVDEYSLKTGVMDLEMEMKNGFLSYSWTDDFLMCASNEQGPVYLFALEENVKELMGYMPEPLKQDAVIITGQKLEKTQLTR